MCSAAIYAPGIGQDGANFTVNIAPGGDAFILNFFDINGQPAGSAVFNRSSLGSNDIALFTEMIQVQNKITELNAVLLEQNQWVQQELSFVQSSISTINRDLNTCLAAASIFVGDFVYVGASYDTVALIALSTYRNVTGNLSFTAIYAGSLALPLRQIGGTITLKENSNLMSVRADNLRSTGQIIVTSNPILATLSFIALSSIASSLRVASNSILSLLSFDSLVSIGDTLEIADNSNLNGISFPMLTRVLRVNICNNSPFLSVPANVYVSGSLCAITATCLPPQYIPCIQ
jgi:hypothetical protein